ncbi:ChaN family lipoprotein [Hydrogenothermus marinus]|uniref:Putative iron-regulated protein n=1 Tax=Hydrogenothermus marinus TaxID=133270 RepID=A0A3M0BKH0_9AQUI|nr:ChaN family lipoprotein [Hydrogenothermus marinus]RMA97963.1 putative iron-regulated protein [Hydrogenothermus marinus]
MQKYIIIIFLFLFNLSFAKIDYFLELNIQANTLNGIATINYDKEKPKIFYKSVLIIKKIKEKKNQIKIFFSRNLNYKEEITIFSDGNFYPTIDELAYYHLKLKIPNGFIPISESENIIKKENVYIFEFPYKAEGINIFARKDYKIEKLKIRDDLTIYGYFYKNGTIKLLFLAKDYIKHYESMFGKFPYKRFSIVETSYPYGFSFPTFTTIFSFLINKDFIFNSSLPHEILHQWFGCSIYVDSKNGNWSEGLTTYFSDYYFSKNKKEYRKITLEKYDALANKNIPLKDFKYKKDKSYEALGYGKGMFFFYMLENLVGKNLFLEGIRTFYKENKFKRVGFYDIETSIEKYYKKSLEPFFNQWLNKAYNPDFSFKINDVIYNIDHFEIFLTFIQKEKFSLNLPVVVETNDGKERKVIQISDKKQKVKIKTKSIPFRIYIDPEYQVFRILKDEEIDPLLYYGLKNVNKLNKNFKISNLENKNILFIDNDFSYLKNIIGNFEIPKGKFVYSFKNPLGNKKFIFLTNDEKLYKLATNHYGNYTGVIFGKDIKKARSISFYEYYKNIYDKPEVVDIQKGAYNFQNLLKNIKNKRLIYIGENHTEFEDHIIQLEIIKNIYKKYKRIVIGMEMIQKPFQQVVDNYIDGKISEKQFLSKIEYYKRWGYDYRLYKPIFDFARKNKIKIIALNLPVEITEKVRKCGLGCLSEKYKKYIPKNLDFSNKEYREFLKIIYSMHSKNKGNFIYFYENQILWDETMAETIASFIKQKPDYKLIILAGNGHLRYRYGIPDRVKRRTELNGVVILNNDEIRKNIADYIIYMDKIRYKKSPKLGVFIEEKDGKVIIKKVLKNSLAEKLGLKKEDIIVQVSDMKIKNIYDLKLALTFLKKGEFIYIKRKGKLIKIKTKFTA